MKTILFLLSLSLVFFVTADQTAEGQCNIENYRDFISKPGVHKCDLESEILKDKYLFDMMESPLDYPFANFSGANLRFAELREANLPGADFSKADLTGAILIVANLTGANFTGADMVGVNLYRANLTGADFRGADLTFAYLIKADLTGADFRGADLTRAKVTPEQAKYLKAQDLSGFVVVKYPFKGMRI